MSTVEPSYESGFTNYTPMKSPQENSEKEKATSTVIEIHMNKDKEGWIIDYESIQLDIEIGRGGMRNKPSC